MIRTEHLQYEYEQDEEAAGERKTALQDISLQIAPGSYVAVLGPNGSGKSTFARQLNALLVPTGGTVWIGGRDTAKEENVWPIRRDAGMVFQNPDNQIIATLVEDDVGFGPENLGLPTEEIWKRVRESLQAVDMEAYADSEPNRLSGGQKQRVAIAGVMAMRPRCIILDEPTAMLDPIGRREVVKTIRELNEKENITVILITHHMEETVDADRILVLEKGKLIMDGTPREIFSEADKLTEIGLEVPTVTRLAQELCRNGLKLPAGILTEEELSEALRALPRSGKAGGTE